jgi:hypothetical protein
MRRWVSTLAIQRKSGRYAKLMTITHNKSSIDRCRIGAGQIDPDLSSATDLRLANSWLSDCRITHESYLRNVDSELSRRVADTRDADGSSHSSLLYQ